VPPFPFRSRRAGRVRNPSVSHSPLQLPRHFCWTKFGSEAGEPIEQILDRKEQERVANGGVFLWGIGNSVAPGIRRLVGLEAQPLVVFSPMRAAAKAVDVRPQRVLRWREATDLSGCDWPVPAASIVTSRAWEGEREKKTHYALVCRSDVPLQVLGDGAEISFDALRNLESGNRLGFSQVTSVVQLAPGAGAGPHYRIGFVAALAFPYFVELTAPQIAGGHPAAPSGGL
jgi:hypothetical protein